MGVVSRLAGEGRIPSEARVIYGDTDSVMVKLPGVDPGDCAPVAELIGRESTAQFPRPMALMHETTLCPYIIESKKRYAGRHVESGAVLIKGLSCKRRDYPQVVRDSIESVLNELLKGGDEAPRRALEAVEEVMERVAEGRVPIGELSITKELNKQNYKTPPPHLVVSRKMARRHPEDPPKPGDRICYVVLSGTGNVSNRVEEMAEVARGGQRPDFHYYNDMIANQTRELVSLAGEGVAFESMSRKLVLKALLYSTQQSNMHAYFQPVVAVSRDKKHEAGSADQQQTTTMQQSTIGTYFTALDVERKRKASGSSSSSSASRRKTQTTLKQFLSRVYTENE